MAPAPHAVAAAAAEIDGHEVPAPANGSSPARRRRSSDGGQRAGAGAAHHQAARGCEEDVRPAPPDAPAVRDAYSAVYVIIFLLGVGVLLPWNIFITETAFFNSRVHAKPYPPELANNFESLFATVFQTSSFLTLSLYVLFQKRIPMAFQVPLPLFCQFFLMLLTVLSVYEGRRLSGDEMLTLVLPGLAVSGVCTAMLQGGVIALVAAFPAVYMQAVLSGMALAGLLVSASSFVACLLARTDDAGPAAGGRAAAQESIDSAAFMNFVAGLSILALCCVLFVAMQLLPFAKHHLRRVHQAPAGGTHAHAQRRQQQHQRAEPEDERRRLLGDEDDAGAACCYYGDAAGAAPGKAAGDLERGAHEELPLLGRLKGSPHDAGAGAGCGADSTAQALRILYKVRFHFASVVLTFVATLSVFPGVIALIVSEKNTARPPASLPPAGPLYGDCFVPLLFVLFNATDLLGRLAGGLWSAEPPNMRGVLRMVCSRAVLVPLVCMCNVVSRNPVKKTEGNGWGLPVLFHDDLSCFVLVVLVGLTNGLPVSVAMMHAPAELEEEEIETGGALMAWAIVLGVASGSTLSLLLSASLSQ